MEDDHRRQVIAILIGTLEAGGAQRMALAVAEALLDTGFEVRIYVLDADHEMPLTTRTGHVHPLTERIRHLSTARTSAGTLAKALAFPRLRIRLEAALVADHAAVTISFMERANLLNLLGRRRIPRVISIRKHLTMALKDKGRLKSALIRFGYPLLLRRATEINFNAAESAADFRRRFAAGATPVSVIPNFVASDLAARAAEDPGADARALLAAPVILSAGRLLPVKGHAALIRAFASIAAARPSLRLVILGEGPLRPHLEALRDALGLQDRIALPGFEPNPFAWMARASLFVLPSRAEGFPNALLEALYLGCPVVATDCPSGARELLAPETDPSAKADRVERAPHGVLTPPLSDKDPAASAPLCGPEAALADAMAYLADHAEARYHYADAAGRRGRDFERSRILGQWIDLVERSLETTPRRQRGDA